MVATVALLSIPIIPMCEGKFIEWRGKLTTPLWGSILVAGQALLMVLLSVSMMYLRRQTRLLNTRIMEPFLRNNNRWMASKVNQLHREKSYSADR